ncbi:hypothetical protein DdX_06197 [Ditylenchus destructor]|uniref:Uncharacterized protein n=1 Tax=Ditylenchus destructor TaxID=166010 RepID=A0AAD4N5S4_9BILA|nr:hypothetical protein DdX_06197 [Ditylenchus destructor]
MSQFYYFAVLVASLFYVRSTEAKDCQDLILVPIETNGWLLGAKLDAKQFPVQIPKEETDCVQPLLDVFGEKKARAPCNATAETLAKLASCPQGNYTKFMERWLSDTRSTFCFVGIPTEPQETTTPQTSTTTTGPSSTTKKPKPSNENINSSEQNENDSSFDGPYVEENDDSCFPVKINPEEQKRVQAIVDLERNQISSGIAPCTAISDACQRIWGAIRANRNPQWTYVYAKHYFRVFYDQRLTFCSQ